MVMSQRGQTERTPGPGANVVREDSIARIAASILDDPRTRHLSTACPPDRQAVGRILGHLMTLVFPGFYGPRNVGAEAIEALVTSTVGELSTLLAEQIAAALRYQLDVESRGHLPREANRACEVRAERLVDLFLSRLPAVRGMLSLDVQAAYDGDPAAHHTDEAILCYPGVRAITVHRLAHELYRMDVPLLPRIMNEIAHAETGIDIHPGASIGASFFIDHGTGVVIGETTEIGDHCKLYQGVTLGAKSFPKDEKGRLQRGIRRHPRLEDHVTVYAGTTILGGDTVIGAGSVVNGGVFLTSSVPPGHVVRGPRVDLTLRSNPEMPPGMYAI
jgi:serine O-acetyltransferase